MQRDDTSTETAASLHLSLCGQHSQPHPRGYAPGRPVAAWTPPPCPAVPRQTAAGVARPGHWAGPNRSGRVGSRPSPPNKILTQPSPAQPSPAHLGGRIRVCPAQAGGPRFGGAILIDGVSWPGHRGGQRLPCRLTRSAREGVGVHDVQVAAI